MVSRPRKNLVRRWGWDLKQKWLPPLVGAVLIVVFFALLQVLITIGLVSAYVVPLPTEIVTSFQKLVLDEGLFRRFSATFFETFVASILAIAVGVLIGWALQRWRTAREAYLSWVVVLASAPLILLFPLFLVFFGRSGATIVAMSFVSALPPIILKTCEGLLATRQVFLNVGKSFKFNQMQTFWMIQFPAAVPTMFNGIRLGIIYALLTVVGVEYLINYGGLGELIADLADRFEIASMYGAIIFVVLVSAFFFFVLDKLENWICPAP